MRLNIFDTNKVCQKKSNNSVRFYKNHKQMIRMYIHNMLLLNYHKLPSVERKSHADENQNFAVIRATRDKFHVIMLNFFAD